MSKVQDIWNGLTTTQKHEMVDLVIDYGINARVEYKKNHRLYVDMNQGSCDFHIENDLKYRDLTVVLENTTEYCETVYFRVINPSRARLTIITRMYRVRWSSDDADVTFALALDPHGGSWDIYKKVGDQLEIVNTF